MLATQHFARSMNYDPKFVGKPLFYFRRTPVCNPVWYLLSIVKFYRFSGFLPYYFAAAQYIMWFGLAALLFALLWTAVMNILFHDKKNLYGTARFATRHDLAENGLLSDGGVVCGELSNAIVLANKRKDASVKMKLLLSSRLIAHPGVVNTLLLAPTGSGKGVSVIIPTLFSIRYSVIVFDPKGENYNITGRWRSQFSRVIRFAPGAYNTLRFNPVMAIRDGDEYAYRDCSLLASVLFQQEKAGDSTADYFNSGAKDAITGALLHLRFSDYPDKSLTGLLNFLTKTNEAVLNASGQEGNADLGREQCMEMMHTEHYFVVSQKMYDNRPAYYDRRGISVGDTIPADNIHRLIVNAAMRLQNTNPKEKASMFKTIFSKLQLFDDPMITNATSGNSDFEIEDFINCEEPISLYLCVEYSEIKRIYAVFTVLIDFMLKKFSEGETQHGEVRLKNDVLFLLDEFPVLGYFPTIAENMGVLRGYGVHFLIVCQSLNQLVERYGQNHPFLDHCVVQIVFAPGNINDAKLYSESIGNESVQQGKVSRSGRMSLSQNANLNFSDNDFGRALLDPADIKRMPGNTVLLMVHGMQPYLGKKVVWYADSRFKHKKGKPLQMEDLFHEAAGLPSNVRRREERKRLALLERTVVEVNGGLGAEDDGDLFDNEADSLAAQIASTSQASGGELASLALDDSSYEDQF